MMKPSAGELWYLKQMVSHIFVRFHQQLKTADDVVYNAFSKAATTLGLLDENSESHICMKEAVQFLRDPTHSRSLFYLIRI